MILWFFSIQSNSSVLGKLLNFIFSLFTNMKINGFKPHLTHLSLASLLWDIGKQYSPRCDAAERSVPSGAILFA